MSDTSQILNIYKFLLPVLELRSKSLLQLFRTVFLSVFYIIDLFMLMLQLLTIVSSIDDQNYPEKTHTYFIVNAPYIFSACWKVSYYCYPNKKRRCCSVWLCFLHDIFIQYNLSLYGNLSEMLNTPH